MYSDPDWFKMNKMSESSLGSIEIGRLAGVAENTSGIPPAYKDMAPAELKQKVAANKHWAKALVYYLYGDIREDAQDRISNLRPELSTSNFLAVHPTAFDFLVFAEDFVKGRIAARNPQKKVKEYSVSMNQMGRELYGKQWTALKEALGKPRLGPLRTFDRIAALLSQGRERGENILKTSSEARAYVQSMKYNEQGRISGQLLSGFFDAGRLAKFIGPFFCPPDSRHGREIILINEKIDSKLRQMKEEAKRIGEMDLSDREKVMRILQIVLAEASRGDPEDESVSESISKREMLQEVPLGFFFRGQNFGRKGIPVCRHQAKMVHILAKRAGLNSTLVKGETQVKGDKKPDFHEWVEISIEGQLYLVDLTLFPPEAFEETALPERDFKKFGVFQIMNGEIKDTEFSNAPKWQPKYFFRGKKQYEFPQ